MTDKQWLCINESIVYQDVVNGKSVPLQTATAWALLRFFRTGKDWKTEEVKRQWAEEEYAAFLEREKAPKPFKPHLVPA